MAKAINWNNFNQGFGESFNQTISELRRLREQREQFDQEMGFRERQLGLENKKIEQTSRYYDYLDKNLELDKEQSVGTMLGQGFNLDIESPEFNLYGKGFDYPKPEPPKPIEQFLGSQVRNGIQEYMYGYPQEGDDVITKIDRTTIPNSILNPKTSGDGGEKPYKEGELTEAGAKSLAFFTNPTANLGGGFLGIGGTSKEEAQQMLDHNFSIFAKDILSSDTYRYIKNYLDIEGYLDPETLKMNAINDAKQNRLTDKQINEVVTFLNYYDTAYDGIKQILEYAK